VWCEGSVPSKGAVRVLRPYPGGMEYTLAHGTANDFVVLADLDDRIELSAMLARALCDRRRGVGADGVLRLGAPATGAADVFMDHRNADGSTALMCGNGVRVVAKHVLDHGLLDARRASGTATGADGPLADVVRVQTRSGVKVVRVVARHADGRVDEVAVDMGHPVLAAADVPFRADDDTGVLHTVELDDAALVSLLGKDAVEFAVVSMGNPHAVLTVDDVDVAPVSTLGPWIESHRRFPQQANVGFAQVVSREAVRLRVFERGVGETAACGTGACAAVVALQRQGLVDTEVAVHLPGGTLTIAHSAGGTVTMTGPAVEVAHGVLDTAWSDAVRRAELEVDAP
jgi:diaminopimelate epimerase